jgi:hypothetical protein
MDVEKLILLVKEHEAIYDASHCDTGAASYIYYDVHNNKNNKTNNSNNDLVVIRPSI